jgi:hypothetical protein
MENENLIYTAEGVPVGITDGNLLSRTSDFYAQDLGEDFACDDGVASNDA